MEKPYLSIVIPVYNRGKFIASLIESISRQSYPNEKFEVVIVDDGSTDDTKGGIERLQKLNSCNLRYFYQKNKGPAAARNLGLNNSKGEIVVFTDSDCLVSHNWLEEISKGYDNKRVAGVGGTVKAMPIDSVISSYCAYIRMNERPKMNKTGIVYLITANASFRKSYLDLIGGFDERYTFPGGEDPDLCYRLREKGYYFKYNSKAIVFNPHKNNLIEFIRTYYNYGKGEAFLILRKKIPGNFSKKHLPVLLFYFLKILFKAVILAIENFIIFVLKFVKIPLMTLIYYGAGFNFSRSLAYSFLSYVKDVSFKYGFFIGYILIKFNFLENVKYGHDKENS